jgi:hypothetical protein
MVGIVAECLGSFPQMPSALNFRTAHPSCAWLSMPLQLTQAERWSLLSRTTMCVMDGPAEAGYLIARLGPDGSDAAPSGWDDAVERAAGSLVVFGTEPHARAFFVRSLSTRSSAEQQGAPVTVRRVRRSPEQAMARCSSVVPWRGSVAVLAARLRALSG